MALQFLQHHFVLTSQTSVSTVWLIIPLCSQFLFCRWCGINYKDKWQEFWPLVLRGMFGRTDFISGWFINKSFPPVVTAQKGLGLYTSPCLCMQSERPEGQHCEQRVPIRSYWRRSVGSEIRWAEKETNLHFILLWIFSLFWACILEF